MNTQTIIKDLNICENELRYLNERNYELKREISNCENKDTLKELLNESELVQDDIDECLNQIDFLEDLLDDTVLL